MLRGHVPAEALCLPRGSLELKSRERPGTSGPPGVERGANLTGLRLLLSRWNRCRTRKETRNAISCTPELQDGALFLHLPEPFSQEDQGGV